jgi:small subunit ribosomal protein S6
MLLTALPTLKVADWAEKSTLATLNVHKEIKIMKTVYETMYILRPDLGDEQVEQIVAKYDNMLKDLGANDIQIQNRGKRRLAYEIKKQRDGVYIQMNYTGPGTAIFTLERSMRLSEEVIRYLTIKQEVHEPKAEAEPVAVAVAA